MKVLAHEWVNGILPSYLAMLDTLNFFDNIVKIKKFIESSMKYVMFYIYCRILQMKQM